MRAKKLARGLSRERSARQKSYGQPIQRHGKRLCNATLCVRSRSVPRTATSNIELPPVRVATALSSLFTKSFWLAIIAFPLRSAPKEQPGDCSSQEHRDHGPADK